MMQTSPVLTPEAYRQSLTAFKELGDHNVQFFGALLERQQAFLTAWWHQNAEPAMALAATTDVSTLLDTSTKLAASNCALIQEHTKSIQETFSKAGEFAAKWYEQHLPTEAKPAVPASATTPPLRVPGVNPSKAA
jgi:hypothetical protein